MEKQVYVSYFSPTGNTKRAALMLGKALAKPAGITAEIDLSSPRLVKQEFAADDILICAVPVFGGRIPAFTVHKIALLQGNGAQAIAIVAYGNRAYEDALLELSDCLTQQGFTVTAAAAVLAEHSMLRSVAAGRPDRDDQQQITTFASEITAKLLNNDPQPVKAIPGNRPYKEWQPMPVTPAVSEKCNSCGKCASTCPTQAIPPDKPQTTAAEKCILCLRCTTVCPQQARSLPQQAKSMISQKLDPIKSIRKENEFFC